LKRKRPSARSAQFQKQPRELPDRRTISKRDRFEVFKRDGFTCQYCGGTPPEFILVVDHIEPVSRGGSNEFINLITSCSGCNSGKSDIPVSAVAISPDAVMERRRIDQEMAEAKLYLEEARILRIIEEESNDFLLTSYSEIFDRLRVPRLSVRQIKCWRANYSLREITDAWGIAAQVISGGKEFSGQDLFKYSTGIMKNRRAMAEKEAAESA